MRRYARNISINGNIGRIEKDTPFQSVRLTISDNSIIQIQTKSGLATIANLYHRPASTPPPSKGTLGAVTALRVIRTPP
jgi:hypothetical protein